MRYGELTVHCPQLEDVALSEAEVLGASVWLWMHSLNHRDAPLHVLPVVLLPIIKRQQYVLIEEKGRPIFFLSWAWMNEEAERRYLTQETVVLPEEDWCNGDRMWFRDFIAPFGHAEALFRLVREEIFPHHVARFLWHRGNEKGRRIKTFYGRQVTREALLNWKHTHPLHGQK
ncbi:toxin-activating lysine-acyltransferase [Enterobacter kobei]|uniref:toxin-activating lysine-acyltransferase n=1 Tax=Enterobacter kobei TaxID=208224 RepID=UPI0009032ADD|nr:toxin-activating lysine-acyltransferase [Enterobacter kobei]OJH27097.1 RTX toxin acyltransferase [Enterobacter kobei]